MPKQTSTGIDGCTPSVECKKDVFDTVAEGVVIFEPTGLLGNGSAGGPQYCTGEHALLDLPAQKPVSAGLFS